MAVQSYVIEIADEAAGIVVQERGGFRFYAASSACGALNQHVFASVGGAERACEGLMKPRPRHSNSLQRFGRGDVTALASASSIFGS
jgi:hypothetical protein